MNKIGIICAGDTELEPFLKIIQKPEITEKAMLKFYSGTINQTKTVALYSGVCKVNAAIATQILIDTYQVSHIINAGTAGGMSTDVQLFDTIISERVIYHDVADDILTEFHPWLKTNYFEADQNLITIAKKYGPTAKHPILYGTMVTGEQFITDENRAEINQKYAPLSVDMETAAIAHVCYVNKIPFISVRTITDTITNKGIENFEKNCEAASERSAKIVQKIIQNITQNSN